MARRRARPRPRIAALLRSLRRRAELSPRQLADKLGVDLSTVYEWERDGARLEPRRLKRLLAAVAASDRHLELKLKYLAAAGYLEPGELGTVLDAAGQPS